MNKYDVESHKIEKYSECQLLSILTSVIFVGLGLYKTLTPTQVITSLNSIKLFFYGVMVMVIFYPTLRSIYKYKELTKLEKLASVILDCLLGIVLYVTLYTSQVIASADSFMLFFYGVVAMLFFNISFHFKVKQECCCHYSMLKELPTLELDKCIKNIQEIINNERRLIIIAFIGATLGLHIISQLHTNNPPLLSIVLFILFLVMYLVVKAKLHNLKIYQLRLYFPEVDRVHKKQKAERKALEESEKHLPWFKRTF